MERFYVVKVQEPINAKKIEDNWLVKQHLEEHKSFAAHTSKSTYFVLEGAAKPIVVSSYGDYTGLENFAPGQLIRLNDDGNGTTRFGYGGGGRVFTIKAVITPPELPSVVSSGKLNFYVVK